MATTSRERAIAAGQALYAGRRRRAFSALACCAAVSIGLAACSSSPSASGSSGDKNFVVDLVEPLTGPNSSTGTDILRSVKAEAALLNKSGGILGHHIVLYSEDDQSQVQPGISDVKQIEEQHPSDLLVTDPAASQYMLAVAGQHLVVNTCPAPECNDPQKYPLAFSTTPSDNIQAGAIISYLKQKGITKAGLIADNETGPPFVQAVQQAAAGGGVKIVAEQTFQPTATDISGQLQKLKSAGAPVVIDWSIGPETGPVAAGMQAIGWDAEIIGPPALFTEDLTKVVPASEQDRTLCMCFRSGAIINGKINTAMKPLAPYLAKYGPVNSLFQIALGADTLALASYAYKAAGKLDNQAAAKALENIGTAKNVPVTSFYSLYGVNPGFTPTNHTPAASELTDSTTYWAIGHVAPMQGGGFIGVPITP
jgi:branched-chain amino acid transport system substrate-binding protein